MSDSINRNPHPDFKKAEASREAWDPSSKFSYVQTPDPNWKFGHGRNSLPDPGKDKKHVSIDPYEEGRPGALNYKLLISAITPRPIAMVSTRSSDGQTENLAVFSYFNVINHDPPLFIIGIASSMAEAKDTLRNIIDTKEAVINIISEPILEAANSTSINAPFGAPEWDVSGLTRDYSCETVKCARVKEAVFSIEAKLDMLKEWESRAHPGKKTGTLVILEGTRMWAREDAINEDRSIIDPAVSYLITSVGLIHAKTDVFYRSCDPCRGWEVSPTLEQQRALSSRDPSLRKILVAKRLSRSFKLKRNRLFNRHKYRYTHTPSLIFVFQLSSDIFIFVYIYIYIYRSKTRYRYCRYTLTETKKTPKPVHSQIRSN